MSSSTALRLAPLQDAGPEAGPFEVRAVGASLFSTLVAALIESLMPNATVRFVEVDASSCLRTSDVLLRHEPSGRSLVVFGASPDRLIVSNHLTSGTQSMISVDASKDELVAAVQSLLSGPPFVSTGVVVALSSARETPPESTLTPREQEVVGYVVQGLSNREMAERLCLSPNTIRSHLQSASAKLGVNSRTRLAARARSLGIA